MPTSYQQSVINRQPIGYWPCDEASSATHAADYGSGANPAVREGGVTFGHAGPPGNGGATSALFPGTNGNALDIRNGGGTNPDADLALQRPFTLEFFADVQSGRSGTSDANALNMFRWRAFGFEFGFTDPNHGVGPGRFYVVGNLEHPFGSFSASDDINHFDSGWHFYRAAVNPTETVLSVDDVEVAVAAAAAGDMRYDLPGTGEVVIGCDGDNGDDPYRGYVSDVAFFDVFVPVGRGWSVQVISL